MARGSGIVLRVMYSDASDTDYGGFTVEHGCYAARGDWRPEEKTKSSTWRELRAVRMVLESLIPKLKMKEYAGFLTTKMWSVS